VLRHLSMSAVLVRSCNPLQPMPTRTEVKLQIARTCVWRASLQARARAAPDASCLDKAPLFCFETAIKVRHRQCITDKTCGVCLLLRNNAAVASNLILTTCLQMFYWSAMAYRYNSSPEEVRCNASVSAKRCFCDRRLL
jgi:hypothetical protein